MISRYRKLLKKGAITHAPTSTTIIAQIEELISPLQTTYVCEIAQFRHRSHAGYYTSISEFSKVPLT